MQNASDQEIFSILIAEKSFEGILNGSSRFASSALCRISQHLDFISRRSVKKKGHELQIRFVSQLNAFVWERKILYKCRKNYSSGSCRFNFAFFFAGREWCIEEFSTKSAASSRKSSNSLSSVELPSSSSLCDE